MLGLAEEEKGPLDLEEFSKVWLKQQVDGARKVAVGVGAAIVLSAASLPALGAAMGYALGLSPQVEAILSPYLLALQIAPKVAFAPLFVMWLGYTVYPKILVAILIVFFPVLINVLTAMRNLDADMINLARSFSATRMQVFFKVQCPATLPALFSGLRIASTL
ncbi:ABC transporter permease subunit, partial [bacterium]|nr:ABC transporter permease subunit [bacterium]